MQSGLNPHGSRVHESILSISIVFFFGCGAPWAGSNPYKSLVADI